jgi:hypothetical protein
MKFHNRQVKTGIKQYSGAYVFLAVLACLIAFFMLLVPIHITPVDLSLEDINAYLAEQRIKQQKMELQKTLGPNEEVIEIYQDKPVYFQVIDTCNWEFLGQDCVAARTGPGALYKEAHFYYERLGAFSGRIREGQVFPMIALIEGSDGSLWYKINIDRSKLMYPKRFKTDWYVPASHFVMVNTAPIHQEQDSSKHITVILHTQELFAYEGNILFMRAKVSTGTSNNGLGTDTGNFYIWKKTPMAIMEGPLPSMVGMVTSRNLINFEYTLFVPYAMAFEVTTQGISYIHDAYWHNGFGSERSHGCVNLRYEDAAKLYNWTPDPSIVKIPVTILP